MSMLYLAVPIWSPFLGDWEPRNLETMQKLKWPVGFRSSLLPKPKFTVGEFVWFEDGDLYGEIVLIRLSGGHYTPDQGSIEEFIQTNYIEAPVWYVVSTAYQNFTLSAEEIVAHRVSIQKKHTTVRSGHMERIA